MDWNKLPRFTIGEVLAFKNRHNLTDNELCSVCGAFMQEEPHEEGCPNRPPEARLIREIAREITQTWKKVNYAAKPYLNAMLHLDYITDYYIAESAESVVLYFLANARTWRGEDARRLKAELISLMPKRKEK